MKRWFFIIIICVAGFTSVAQETPKKNEASNTLEQPVKQDSKSQVKEVPKVKRNQAQIQKTQQQRKQVKKTQVQKRRAVQASQNKKAVQRRKGHK